MAHPSAKIGMWTCVMGNLNSIDDTLQGLKKELEPVVKTKQKSTLSKVLRLKTWRLGWLIGEILTYRGRLEPHRQALHVGVEMMKM